MRSKAAVLGSPITHSLSPALHNFAYEILGFDGSYEAIEMSESSLLQWLSNEITQDESWIGFSLTMPLKEIVCSSSFSQLLRVDARSRRIQSANTIFQSAEGWSATSTDVTGFNYLLKGRKFTSVAVLGSGGTARAALASLAELETSQDRAISVFRRSATKDQLLRNCSEGTDIEFVDWSKIARIQSYDLVINTVPSAAAAEVTDDFLGVPVLLDALYSPWLPPLSLIQGRTQGELITGLDLLCAQALDQLQLMTKIVFDHVAMFHKLRDHAAKLVS